MKLINCLFLIIIAITSCNKHPGISQPDFDSLIIVKKFTNTYGQLSCEIFNNSKYDVFYDNNMHNEPNFRTAELIYNNWQYKGQWGCGVGLVIQKIKSGSKVTMILPSINENPYMVSIFLYTNSVDLYTFKKIYRNF